MDATILFFAVVGLAAVCFSDFLSDDVWDGPLGILHKLRHWLGIRYDEASNLVATGTIAKALLCPVCSSIWITAMLIPPALRWPLLFYILMPFSVGGLVLLVKYR